jgi:all-trans-8'-apo-beta-carotenal 15,15'-oxygenase
VAKNEKSINRRNFLKLSATTLAVGLPVPALADPMAFEYSSANNESRYPSRTSNWQRRIKSVSVPYEGIVSSLPSVSRYNCRVTGQLPLDLYGSLMRAGPGLFERGEMRRRILIDADGMIRRFNFNNGQATFECQHIRTPKYRAEEKAGRYIYPSFAMKAPREQVSIFTNSVAKLKNQASVTVFEFGGRLFVTDELQPLTEIDMATLKTIGETTLTHDPDLKYCAHHRITYFGERLLHLTSINPLSRKATVHTFNEKFENIHNTEAVKISRSFHDWLVTPDFYVYVLPPLYMRDNGLLRAIAGLETVADAMTFNYNKKTQILLIPRKGGDSKRFELLHTLDTSHSVNAFQTSNGKLIIDFVGSKSPSDSTSNKSFMAKIMRGEMEISKTMRATSVCRTFIDLNSNHVSYNKNYFSLEGVEMPTIDQRKIGLEHENSYFIAGQEALDSKIARINNKTNSQEIYDFGAQHFVTEPIFVPSSNGAHGYLLSEVYSHESKRSFLAVFNSANLSFGPIARVELEHHLPIGFHGFWRPGY